MKHIIILLTAFFTIALTAQEKKVKVKVKENKQLEHIQNL
tara:strand:+ start:9961 stop:10080 length:120 start_codon:yes stop_codon:yes gene_type:complete